MALFSKAQIEQINQVAARSKEALALPKATKPKSINNELNEMSKKVEEYFKDSPAILITTEQELHDYVDRCIEAGYAGIDTETTGLDRINDTIVGVSLYYPGGVECYIPSKHLIPIFDEPYKDQLSYEVIGKELQRLVDAKVKLILANADYDIAMIYKDLKVDIVPAVYYDVILAWRCLKENEKDNTLKGLYNKYPLKGKGDPMKFRDFFSPALFPYCKPQVAKLYAANDAKITFDLFKWQLPYVTKTHPKCQKSHLEKIADLIWNIEFPMIRVCAQMHRDGMYLDNDTAEMLNQRYDKKNEEEMKVLQDMVQDLIDENDYPTNTKRPFRTGKEFNPKSPPHVKYLCHTLLRIPDTGGGTGKEVLRDLNLPQTNQVLAVRSLGVLISTFVKKLPNAVTRHDNRIHAQFRSVGADCITGESILPTATGYRTIRDICESAGCKEAKHVDVDDLVIVNKDQISESAQSVIKYTDYPTIKITTECGFTLEGTYNHPVMVSQYKASDKVYANDKRLSDFWSGRYFKNLEDVSVGDFVEIPCNYWIGPDNYVETHFTVGSPYQSSKTVAKMPAVYDEYFAEFLGMYHADGAAYFREGTYTIAFSNDDSDVISKVDELAMTLFNVETSHYTAQADNNEVETYINCIQIHDIDKILSHGKRNKKIPDAIWSSPKSVINSYIKGMTLDSSVYLDENGRIAFELSIIDEQDANLVQYHLASQGILCYRTFNKNKDGWKTPRLAFNADNYMLFRDSIGFIESKKYRETAPCAKNTYSSRRIDDSFRLKVEKIECKTNTVYDLHVPGTHSFVSNGFISHNTGRMSSAEPNMQNIPSHATDIRHMFRATPGYIMLSSDYSQQEPKLTAFVSQDPNMIKSFQENKDIYATIASLAFNLPYEKCLEFHPETGEYQPDGKARRGEAKTIVLGICYGRSVVTIGDQLFGKDKTMSDEEKTKKAQAIYDAVLNAFPNLRALMISAQANAAKQGYVETILGRRRHIPDMQLPEFEFKAMSGYVNPDIDPLDVSTLANKSEIPERIVNQLQREFKNFKYYGQIVKRTKELYEEKIKVINNRQKITEASRQCVNSIIQGSAAELTKMAILKLQDDERWKAIGGRLLTPIHDELLCEVPIDKWKEGGEILSSVMSEAGDFLPFPISCDVTTTYRWYGADFPCKYPQPESLDNLTEDEVKWVQYHLFESEYLLPVYKDENGEKPRGDAALGINGVISDEMKEAIEHYKNRYRISSEQFISHIKNKVHNGGNE